MLGKCYVHKKQKDIKLKMILNQIKLDKWGRMGMGEIDTRILCPWDFPGKNTGVGYYCDLQGIFLTEGLNPGVPHWKQILYCLSHQSLVKRGQSPKSKILNLET